MATKRERKPVMSLYEWNLTLWYMSDARNRLDGTGRGIYRELLDWCYGQGLIPDDHSLMARQCAVTLEQFEAVWPIIKSHFFKSRRKENSLENKIANVHRKQFFEFILKQRSNGSQSAKKRDKLNGDESKRSIGLAMPPLGKTSNQYETIREEKIREDNRSDEGPPPDEAEWIKQALLDFMAGRGGVKFSRGPDATVIAEIWQAISGFTTLDLREFFLELMQAGQMPTRSWKWFVSAAQSEFDARRRNAAS